jgi:leucyl aminopeptidase (aminopeptidase T)
MAARWVELLSPRAADAGLHDVRMVLYRNPRANNANLPATGCFFDPTAGPLPSAAKDMGSRTVAFDQVFEAFQLIIAPTQFSATAPLKMAAAQFGFRAATMPGFSAEMIPALKLDYGVIGARVDKLTAILDRAVRCDIVFDADGAKHSLVLDLRHRKGHASSGVFPDQGTAGNLPSGESYIVPYEGEIEGDPTASAGEIPVQLGDDVVVYRVEGNVAVEVLSRNPTSLAEAERLAAEPAYGNIAELGLGVLGDFGLTPTGQLLLDEKLDLHIAFGRSEHFGGQVGPGRFTSPDKVVHIDRVYTPEIQPRVKVALATLAMEDGGVIPLMENGAYVVDLG